VGARRWGVITAILVAIVAAAVLLVVLLRPTSLPCTPVTEMSPTTTADATMMTSTSLIPSAAWVQLFGSSGGNAGNWFGWSVSLAADGSSLAVGATQVPADAGAGYVQIYTLPAGDLVQELLGEAPNDRFGSSVSLSADGSVLAVGATYNDNHEPESGNARVFQRNGGIFAQVGDSINGEAERDFSGNKISLSADGTMLAVGAI